MGFLRIGLCGLLILLSCGVSTPLRATPGGLSSAAVFAQPTTTKVNSAIQRIRNRGGLLLAGVLSDYQPFGFFDTAGEAAGFEVDLVRALARKWGVEVQFVPVTPSTRLQSLLTGQVDLIAAAMPHTHALEALIDFTQPYFTDAPALLLHPAAQSIDRNNLAGMTIAVIQGDVALEQFALTSTSAVAEAKILPFQEYSPALFALNAGQVDALLAHSTYLTQVAKDAIDFGSLVPLAGRQPFAMGLLQGDSYFRNLIDATLTELQQEGSLAELYAKWLPTAQPLPGEPFPGQWPYTFATSPGDLLLSTTARLAQIQARGKLLVGVAYDLAPFGFVTAEGIITGFDIDLSREFARRWLGDANALELVRVTPDTAIPLLVAGQVDLIAAALPHQWRHRTQIDFSQSYFLDGQSVLTRADRTIATLADLHQKVIAITRPLGGTDDRASLAAAAANSSFEPLLLPFQEYHSAQQALAAGQVDALIGSSTVLAQTTQANGAFTLAVDQFLLQPYAIGIPLFDAELRDLVNLTLQTMKIDGTYDAFYVHWFKTTPYPLELWPDIAATTTNRAPEGQSLPSVTGVPTRNITIASLPPVQESNQGTEGKQPVSVASTLPAFSILLPTSTPILVSASSSATSTIQSLILVPTPAAMAPIPSSLVAAVAFTATVTPPADLANTITIRPDVNVNARQAPTTTAPILVVLAGGTQWPVLTTSPDGQWVQVQLPENLRAWVAVSFVLKEDDSALPTSTGVPTALAHPTSSAPTATATPRLLFSTATSHRVSAADTLSTLAQQYYGTQRLWRLIYDANRTLIGDDPNALPVGAELIIPPPP